ncbi:pseudouridine synthase [Paraburkholderia sacchari]|uniref:Dual-specificity RNA pseudouridine synthase RluF n=1 Tax=Paraburkholderia sacchari TaxID=159450 RepID=A0A8T6ZI48_9BURK|nr:pseudouridine synthase [Paraburkholderia sacchari]NLP64501.1 pseudouridine synthase [Paraburkholderia sacchari]
MRAKLTAKHPRPATPERAPVRRGSTTARKPVRSDEARPAEGRPAQARPSTPKPGGKPVSGKPASARERDTSNRPARAPREGSGYGEERRRRDAGDAQRSAKPWDRDARPARRAEGDERPFPRNRGEGGERRFPRRDEGEGQRPFRARDEGGERRPFRARDEGGERRFPRREEGEGQRPFRARDEGGERRPFRAREEGQGQRPFRARDEGGERRPFRAREEGQGQRPFRARDEGNERRPFRAREEGGERRFPRRDESEGQRPLRARDESTERRFPRRDDGDDRRPAFRRDQSSDERRPRDDRGFARPVKSSWSNANERNAEDARTRKPGSKPFAKGSDQAPRRSPAGGDHTAPQRTARVEIDGDNTLRLSKRMSELGLCSRREADEWIEKGWVYVEGEVVDTLGAKVTPQQRIEVDPAALAAQARQVTILLHKPVGYVSGQAEDGYEPAATLVTAENHWDGDHSGIRFSAKHLRTLAPAGRLDIDSTGLLVLTQDGRVAKQLIGESSDIDKEYLVRVTYGDIETEVDQHFPPELLAKLRHGLSLDDVPLKPAMVSWQNGEQLRFVLREGKKRQIRRMCELVGLKVVGLKRVRMGRVLLGALPQGQWRYLSADETF